MRYLLDTNTCLHYINGRAPRIFEHIREIPDTDIAISAVTKGEMFAGPARSQSPQRSRAKQDAFFIHFAGLDYDEAAANEFGWVRAYLENSGTPIGPYDMQIAAIAILHDLILVTHNIKEFDRISWLKSDDWEV